MRRVGEPGSLSLAVRTNGSAAVITVTGELDVDTGPLLQDRLNEVLATRPAQLVVDLGGVSFLGSGGLAVLIRASRVAAAQETVLRLRGTDRRAVAIPLQTTGLDRFFETAPPP